MMENNSLTTITNTTNITTLSANADFTVGAENIYPALVECFGIIALGYLAGRFKLLSTREANGLGTFVGTFALPAMIFTALCTLDFHCVNWKFVFSIFITKSILFLSVLIVGLVVNHGQNIGKAGLYSIFVTQSNDFALGYPILKALYGQSHPEYPSYLYLLSPISLAILNPIGCVLMEIDKAKTNEEYSDSKYSEETYSIDSTPENVRRSINQCHEYRCNQDKPTESPQQLKITSDIKTTLNDNSKEYFDKWKRYRKKATSKPEAANVSIENAHADSCCPKIGCSNKSTKFFCKIFLGILSNPIIILTIAGVLFGQFVFHGKVPPIINNFLQTLKNSYSAVALFSLGLGMVGKMEALKNGSKLLGPFILIVSKVMLMPLIAREVTNFLYSGSNEDESSRLADFAFLYGTFPTAPTVYVFATRYNIASSIIATTMIACTFVSAPIMFISAQLLAAAKKPYEYHKLLEDCLYEICIISLIAIVWTVFIMFYTSKRWKYMPHSQTLLLLVAQGIACIGSIMYYTLEFSSIWTQYLQFTLLLTGVYGSRINSAIIALTLLLLTKGKAKLVSKLQPYLLILGIFCPTFFVGVLFAVSPSIKHFNGSKSINFKFGETQAIVSLTVLIVSFLTIMLSMILAQRKYKKKKLSELSKSSIIPHSASQSGNPVISIVPVTDLSKKYSEEVLQSVGIDVNSNKNLDEEECCNWKNPREKKRHEKDCQMLRHTVLLIYSAVSMIVGIALCSTRILYENTTEVGIYFIIVFLDTSLNFGQGLMTCAVFGLESKYVFSPLLKWLKKARKIYKKTKRGEQISCDECKSCSLKVLAKVFRAFAGNRTR